MNCKIASSRLYSPAWKLWILNTTEAIMNLFIERSWDWTKDSIKKYVILGCRRNRPFFFLLQSDLWAVKSGWEDVHSILFCSLIPRRLQAPGSCHQSILQVHTDNSTCFKTLSSQYSESVLVRASCRSNTFLHPTF